MLSALGRHRQLVAVAVYAVAIVTAWTAAWLLRTDALPAFGKSFLWPLAVLLGVRLAMHRIHRLTRGRWRYVGMPDVYRLASSSILGTVAFAALNGWGAFEPSIPWSVIALEWLLTVFFTASAWVAYRGIFELGRTRTRRGAEGVRRTLIVGAGESGSLLAREIGRAPTGFKLVGFVDDDPTKRDALILGHSVLGGIDELTEIVERHGVSHVIIAVPSAEPQELRRIVTACETTGVDFRVLPGITEVLAGDVSLRQVRRVTIEDLLGRAPVTIDLPELGQDLSGGVALVTGAAGSIGSELARQIAANRPAALVLLDQAESDLFFIEMELRERHPDLRLVAIVGDVRDSDRLDGVFEAEGITHVYHAAAYKHVPLMEVNVEEAVHNNVVGTRNVFDAAGRQGARSCVLISTDKAVNPSSVMGATKRMCELLLLQAIADHPDTRFTAVRFGNVLGSNGSVVQIFRKQIKTGRLTVTHPEITRYFMTIPEAVRLVLLSSILPEAAGRIAMLEMGEPVRIMDLARNMIRLSGLREDYDVRIEITGLRPGEKLHEELTSDQETTESTRYGKIRLVGTGADLHDAHRDVERLIAAANRGDSEAARAILFEATQDFSRNAVV